MNVGMLGAGTIATWLSNTFLKMGGSVTTYAIASAFPEECPKFVEKYGWKKWYPTYEELMQDPQVDLVYVAVPNPFHYELCKKALEHNKNVICEKPFCVNEVQMRELFDIAESRQLFITEALWSCFLPSRKLIDDVISSGVIGRITHAEITMKNDTTFLNRIKDPNLGGGALLDVGPYTLGRMTAHFGCDIKSVTGEFTYLDTGVDAGEVILIEYENGLKVRVENNISCPDEFEDSVFYGTQGKIVIHNTGNPKSIQVFDLSEQLIQDVLIPEHISGYEFEFLACKNALEQHKTECTEAPHRQSLCMVHMMDELRRMAGIRYPFE